ncbi:YncE family protein [Candidatus Korobacter versatilis]|nr:YncE family protein [Candidatus Koribacter versatilis]
MFRTVLISLILLAGTRVSAQTWLKNIPAGVAPVAVAINPATNKIYVVNSCGTDPACGGPGSVSEIDGKTKQVQTIVVGSSPQAIAINPLTNKIYVTSPANNVTVIDGATRGTTTVSVGGNPAAVAVNPITNKIYVASSKSTVTVIDGVTNGTTILSVGSSGLDVGVNQATNEIYVPLGNGTIAVIDGVTNSISTVADVPGLHFVAINSVTNKIYVSNNFDSSVEVIDGATKSTAMIPVGTNPWKIVVNSVSNKVYVADVASNDVTVIDGATNQATPVSLTAQPQAIAVNPITNQAFVTELGSEITVIDGTTNGTSTVATDTRPFDVAVNPITNEVYVANNVGNDVTLISGDTNRTTNVSVGTRPFAVAVNSATSKIYVANLSSNDVTVIDGKTNTTTAVTTGVDPSAVAVNPVTNKVYVANNYSNDVTVIDGVTNDTTTLQAGLGPDAVAVNPATNTIYVANRTSNNVTIIDGASSSTSTVGTGFLPWALAVNPVTNKIYVANYCGTAGDCAFNGSVTVIDGLTRSTTSVMVGLLPTAIAVNPVTNKIYVANSGANYITIIDGVTNSTTFATTGTSPSDLAVNALTNQIYVVNSGEDDVSVVAGATLNVTTVAASLAHGPIAVAVNPVTNKIYVANNGSNNVTVIDGATNAATLVGVGRVPSAIAVDPTSDRIYVANSDPASTTVTVIDAAVESTIPIASVFQGVTDSQTVAGLSIFATENSAPKLTASVTSTSSPILLAPSAFYYQLDSAQGAWQRASQTNPRNSNPAAYALSLQNVKVGVHTVYAFAMYAGNLSNLSSYPIAVMPPTKAILLTPANGSTLPGASATFTWTNVPTATQYTLYVGSTPGSHDIAFVNALQSNSTTVNNIPTNGASIFVTLYTLINGKYGVNASSYIEAGTPVPAAIVSPAEGSTLAGSTDTFSWTSGTGVSQYSLYVGTKPGLHDIAFINAGMNTSATVTTLPTNGGTLYATLYSLIGGTYQSRSYTYVAAGTATKATMISPANGSTFTGNSATFTWTAGSGVTSYSLYVGTQPGGHDIAFINTGTNTSATVTTLPTNGGTLYVTLCSLIAGTYQRGNYTYVASGTATKATMISPANGTTITGNSATFTWTPGSGVTSYSLYVGTRFGARDLDYVPGTSTSATVTNLPATGGTVYVRLWSYIAGAWQSVDYSYPNN